MKTTRMRRLPARGFTLIELMIVVAIIAILAAIAIPSYMDYVTRSKLSEAYNALSTYRVSMEQYYQDNRTYDNGAACGVAVAASTYSYFTVACTPASGSSAGQAYTATATGKAGTPVADFTFQIDNSNNRQTTATPAGWGTAPVSCWVMRKGGSCQ